jgi:Rps23 Pro-64 3,4-dihydroxylase Tpa1-like proline 4-hydroxylase
MLNRKFFYQQARKSRIQLKKISRDRMGSVNKTLPITLSQGPQLSLEEACTFGAELSNSYVTAAPFAHIVIDNFLPTALIDEILANFPAHTTSGETLYQRGYKGQNKRQINPNQCPPYLKNIFSFLNSAAMLQMLEKLTSITGLIPDPYFDGGGLHETMAGGYLGVHSDFRINKKLHLERRLNAIIYLNKDWKEEYGGNLELWDTQMKSCLSKILPIYNRCVIFNTDQDSNHGHPEPLTTPEGISRKSIALYYYTASNKIYDDIQTSRTIYKPRPQERSSVSYYLKKLIRKKN